MNQEFPEYDCPSVAADIVVFTVRKQESKTYRHLATPVLSVLLVKRAEAPFENQMALPGGFCCRTETIEETAHRKLKEKTGILNPPLSQLCNLSKMGRDPRGWIISCCYWTLIEHSRATLAHNAQWYQVAMEEQDGYYKLILTNDNGETLISKVQLHGENELYNQYSHADITENALAFDHAGIIVRALLKLRSSMEKPYAAFRLLPDTFTLTELQQIYEAILDQKLLMANFRRKIMSYVEETPFSEEGAGHRPSKYYRKK